MNDPEIRDYITTHDLATVATLAKASLDDCPETIRNKIKPAVQVAARCLETWDLDEVNSAVAKVVKQMAHGSAAPWKQARGGGRSVGGGAARAGEPAAAAADAEEQNVNFDHDGGDPDEQLRHCEQLERARLRWQLVSRERIEGKQYGVAALWDEEEEEWEVWWYAANGQPPERERWPHERVVVECYGGAKEAPANVVTWQIRLQHDNGVIGQQRRARVAATAAASVSGGGGSGRARRRATRAVKAAATTTAAAARALA